MSKNGPKVSVLISVYNHEKYVGQAIESVLRQTYQNWELIIMDDCSLDRSPDVVRQYKDRRIQFYRSEENKGPILIFNELLKKATGEYIASLDSDDIWYDNKLEEQVTIWSSMRKWLRVSHGQNSSTRKVHYIPRQKRNVIVISGFLCTKIVRKHNVYATFLTMAITCADQA